MLLSTASRQSKHSNYPVSISFSKTLASEDSNDLVSRTFSKTAASEYSNDPVFRSVSKIAASEYSNDPVSISVSKKASLEYSNDPVSRTVSETAVSIVNSVYRHVTQLIEDRDREKILKGVNSYSPELQQNMHLFTSESLKNLAHEFVNSLINEALTKIDQEHRTSEDDIKAKTYPRTKEAKNSQLSVFEQANILICRIFCEAGRRVDQIKLIGVERFAKYNYVEEFKVKDGLEVVARCVSMWSFNPHWYFKIVYNGRSVSDSYSYYYTVRWSAPSLAYPVAQVTADVYFIIEVFPMTPPPIYIQVCYRLETDRCSRCALKSSFQEKWLHTVFKRKLGAFQIFTF